MPEGPEIRLAADKLAQALVDQEVTDIYFAFDELKVYEPVLRGRAVTAIETYGKALLTRFDNGLNIYSHNQLYGLWYVRPAGQYPETNRQLRLAIHNHDHSALLYSASDIEVVPDDQVDQHPFISKLGPDLLNTATTPAVVADQLRDSRFHRRRLSSLLLDQHFLAGTGNYLRSEILFVAGVPPTYRPADCTAAQLDQLAEAAVNLTVQSYRTKGITNDLALVDRLKEEGVTRRDYRFAVFNRDGQPCFTCGATIRKEQIGGRRLYYCPQCQGA